MREVKIRLWSPYNHRWDYFSFPSDLFMSPPNPGSPTYTNQGEYTGLKDKNGKDIYEGDFIEWEADFGDSDYSDIRSIQDTVVFLEGAFRPMVDLEPDVKIRVIGNVHETPKRVEPGETAAKDSNG